MSEKDYKHLLEILSKTANRFLKFSPNDDVYKYIGEVLLNELPNSYIVVYEVINDGKMVLVKDLFGFSKSLIKGLNKIFGFELLGAELPLMLKQKERLKRSRLVSFVKEEQFLREDIPNKEMKEVIKYLDIRRVFSIGMAEGNEIFGGVDIISSKDDILYKEKFVETFIRQASLAINRLDIDKKLIKSKEKAEESDRLKTAFLANMSHEIRTPMNAILGFSQLLKHPSITKEKRNNYLNIIDDKGNDLLRILNDLIDISLIESNQLVIEKKDFSINALMAELYMLYASKMKPGILFSIEKSKPDELSYINSDPVRIKQIFTNLLNNAIKYTSEGFIRFGYKIADNNKLIFFVKDSGIGIPNEMQNDVFKRFFQISESIIRSYSGNGLGLTICKELTELLSGKIWVTSVENEGAEFSFSIPYELITNKNAQESKEDKVVLFDLQGIKILVAEDDEANYDYVYEILSIVNAEIVWAKDGLKAINKFKEHKDIDIILMDLKMPRMGGLDAIGQIREINTDIPIIAQTAYAMEGDKEQCIKMGCNDYITKPLQRDSLLEMIIKYI